MKGGVIIYPDASWGLTSSIVTVGNSPTVTIPPPPFTSNMVGWKVWGNNYASGNTGSGGGNSSPEIPLGTIVSVDSTTQIHVSTTSTAACTSTAAALNCILEIGPVDDTASLQAAWAATIAACGTLVLPATTMFVSAGIIDTTNNSANGGACGDSGANNAAPVGTTVVGQGSSSSILAVLPGFNATSCNGSAGAELGCFFTMAGANSESGQSLRGFSIFGGGAGASNGATHWVMQLGNDTVMRDVKVIGWKGIDFCIRNFPNAIPGIMDHVVMNSCGGVSELYGNASGVMTNSVIAGSGNETSSLAQFNGNQGAYFYLAGNSWKSPASTKPVILVNVGTRLAIEGDFPVTSTVGFIQNFGVVHAKNIPFVSINSGQIGFKTESGGSTFVSDTHVLNTSQLGTAVSVAAGGSFFDECGIDWGHVNTPYSISGNYFGSCSVTGTNLVAGNLVPSANWGSGAAISVPLGDSQNFSFTLTNGSATVGASPTIAFTYPTPFAKTPICTIQQLGGTQAILATTAFLTPSAGSATTVTLTYNGTPTINLTELYQGSCH